MKLKIRHETRYSYDSPVAYALQRLRLEPRTNAMQSVRDWTLKIEGADEQVAFIDHFGNATRLLAMSGEPHVMTVIAEGNVETHDRAGVLGTHSGFAPLWLFSQATNLTRPGPLVSEFAHSLNAGDGLDLLHSLCDEIRQRVAYVIGSTDPSTTVEMAMESGQGVCQDHAHIFLAAARLKGFPARYISGYLLLDDRHHQVASHAWAEAHVDGLGWVGFDISNGISPDERYVRLAVGRDYRDAMPTSGIRLGIAQEALAVSITVEQ